MSMLNYRCHNGIPDGNSSGNSSDTTNEAQEGESTQSISLEDMTGGAQGGQITWTNTARESGINTIACLVLLVVLGSVLVVYFVNHTSRI
jgi:hypothetical protein